MLEGTCSPSKSRTAKEVSYNPAQHRAETMKAMVERHESRDFAVGERIQFTAPDKALGVRSGDLGSIESITGHRSIAVRLDNGKTVDLNAKTSRAIDYGYAVDGSKAVSADRVLVSVAIAPQLTGESKIFQSLYAAKHDAAIYTSDASTLSRAPILSPPRPPTEIEQLREAVATLGRNENPRRSGDARPAGPDPGASLPRGTSGIPCAELRRQSRWNHCVRRPARGARSADRRDPHRTQVRGHRRAPGTHRHHRQTAPRFNRRR